MVIINSTDKEAFHQLLPANGVPGMAVGEEVEWFADVAESIIGTIAFDARNKGWNYVILTRAAGGEFRVCEQHANFPTRHAGRLALWRRMAGSGVVEGPRVAA